MGQEFLFKVANDTLAYLEKNDDPPHPDLEEEIATHIRLESLTSQVKSQLELDGYVYRTGKLYEADVSVIDERQEHNYLQLLVDDLSLGNSQIIKNHLSLSEEHYLNGKWGDTISNSRNFLEAILQQIGDALNVKKYGVGLPTNVFKKPVLIREYLEKERFLDSAEKESIAKVYGLLSNTGSHPNIPAQDQARLMRHLALTFSQFVLLKYEGYLKNNP